MAEDAVESITLKSKDGLHRWRIFVREDGRLTTVKLSRNNDGEWVGPPSGQSEKVLAAWAPGHGPW